MKKSIIFIALIIAVVACRSAREITLGKLKANESISFTKNADGKFGLLITKDGKKLFDQKNPMVLNFFNGDGTETILPTGYTDVSINQNKAICKVSQRHNNATFTVVDIWSVIDNDLSVKRSVKVSGDEEGGFMSSISLNGKTNFNRSDAEFFVPGMIYGDPKHLTKNAIGGVTTKTTIQIREDRLPAPLFGTLFKDGSSIAVFNPKPDGTTTQEDCEDYAAKTITDSRFKFGAIGVNWQANQTFNTGYWFPGTEGENTYAGNTYPGGQMNKWRKRFHPIKNGFEW